MLGDFLGAHRARGIAIALGLMGGAGCTMDFDRFAPRVEPSADTGPGLATEAGTVADATTSMSNDASSTVESGSAVDAGTPTDGSGGGGTDAVADGGCVEARSMVFQGHCYFPTTARTNWTAASMACQAAGAHLVTITSAEEQAAVAPIVGTQDRWIGLSRPQNSLPFAGSFVWVTAEPVMYTHWAQGEPNFSGECARIQQAGTWADNSCANTTTAICERD
jgi:hypothetical protein